LGDARHIAFVIGIIAVVMNSATVFTNA
jgi:hypothetical protein